MGFSPEVYAQNSEPVFTDHESQKTWVPIYWHDCTFSPEIFHQVMQNLIRNPNINSNHLFRGDILLDEPFTNDSVFEGLDIRPRILHVNSFNLKTVMIRKLIPRNLLVDAPMDQTCLIYERRNGSETGSLVMYLPHTSAPDETPFYHPAVYGIGFLHTYNTINQTGVISIHFAFYDAGPRTPILDRTALHLLAMLSKHGQGNAAGYKKRVHHDAIIPQATLQDTYARLKSKYAKLIIEGWVEQTDPAKHVFEDLGIVAFLIELWKQIYTEANPFPGFVDIGCGNGLVVHILIEEGYSGWGFDARSRRSWSTYSRKAQENLKELVLIPSIIRKNIPNATGDQWTPSKTSEDVSYGTHSGEFPKGTFIISNHADELTPWTPILATLSQSPFISIPCCSHNLTGARQRAPAPKEKSASNSAYASLVSWVAQMASDCGWEVEKEMLRIPSTRNAAIVGRVRSVDYAAVNIPGLIERYGGADGWEENAMKLIKGGLRGH